MTQAQLSGTAILVWSADLAAADRIPTLFLTAQACAAMELETELYFTAGSVALLRREHQDRPVGYGREVLTLGEHMARTAAAGVRMYACSQAMEALSLSREALVPQAARLGGIVQFAARCADPAWRTIVF